MVKIKLKNKLNEASATTVDYNAGIKTDEERQAELNDIWGSLMQHKAVDIRKLYKTADMYGLASLESIPLSKINVPVKCKVKDAATGELHDDEIIPAEIIAFCEMAKTAAMNTPDLGPILGRFQKRIIWTFKVNTAASDGIRIAFNPILAQELLYQGKAYTKELIANGKANRMSASERQIAMAKYFLFVLCHECYHQIYRHNEQAERKTETQGGANHHLANTAMDVEINRDLEKQLPSRFSGVTEAIDGMFDARFKMEPWQDIFDAYYYNNVEPPKGEQEAMNNSGGIKNGQQGQGQQGQGGQNGQSGQQGQNQSGQGQQGQSGQNGQSGSAGQGSQPAPSLSGKSKEYQDAYIDEVKKELDKLKGKQGTSSSSSNGQGNQSDQEDSSDSDNGSGSSSSNNGQMSEEERQARSDARRDVKQAIEDMKNQIEEAANTLPSDEEINQAMEGKEIETTTSSTFGGADMVSQEQMAKLAAEAGEPYTADELTCDPNEVSAKYNRDNMSKLTNISPDLTKKLTDIQNVLKTMESLANWKQKLRKHFNIAMAGDVESKRSKRVMSQNWRFDKYNPYKEVTKQEFKGANIFYLIDNSGSMYSNGDGIFYQIFKEIMTIEKSCKVLRSARAYFTTGTIKPENVEMWDIKTPIAKRLDLLGDRGNTGGTDIPGNTVSVTKLKAPYYYSKGEKHTTIIIFTDGEDNGWETLKEIPGKIRKDLVFIVFNPNVNFILKTFKEIMNQGIPMANLIGIDTTNFGKKDI